MDRAGMVVLIATMASWAVSLPFSFGFVYGDCAPACLGAGICLQAYVCRDAWSSFPAMMLAGAVSGLAAGGIGYAYHASRHGIRSDGSARTLRQLLAPLPFVLLGAVFYVLLLPGLKPLVGAWALLLAIAISVAIAGTVGRLDVIRSSRARSRV